MALKFADVYCLECGTGLGGNTGKDAYKHMLHCLKVEQDSLSRMRVEYGNQGGEHAKRVLHLVDHLLAKDARSASSEGVNAGEGD